MIHQDMFFFFFLMANGHVTQMTILQNTIGLIKTFYSFTFSNLLVNVIIFKDHLGVKKYCSDHWKYQQWYQTSLTCNKFISDFQNLFIHVKPKTKIEYLFTVQVMHRDQQFSKSALITDISFTDFFASFYFNHVCSLLWWRGTVEFSIDFTIRFELVLYQLSRFYTTKLESQISFCEERNYNPITFYINIMMICSLLTEMASHKYNSKEQIKHNF